MRTINPPIRWGACIACRRRKIAQPESQQSDQGQYLRAGVQPRLISCLQKLNIRFCCSFYQIGDESLALQCF